MRANRRTFDTVERTQFGTSVLNGANALSALRQPSELLPLALLAAWYWLIYLFDLGDLMSLMNVAGPTLLIAILIRSCYRMAAASPVLIWAPLFWFRLACAVYFGLGALAPHIGNEETRSYIYALIYFDEAQNFKVNFITIVGVSFILLVSDFILKHYKVWKLENKEPGVDFQSERRSALFAFLFLFFGGLLRYGLVVPYYIGLSPGIVPGMIVVVSNVYYVGMLLFVLLAHKRPALYLPLIIVLAIIEITVSIATFAKTELILIIIFISLGILTYKFSRTRVAVCVISAALAYIIFSPVVEYGRGQLIDRYGEITGAPIGERLAIVSDWWERGRYRSQNSSRQAWLVRLSYVNVNAYIVDSYDRGLPGETFKDAPAVIVPRVFWSDKPIISRLGQDLNYLVFQSQSSQLGVGHFSEAYWNFGWLGLVVVMPVLAMILSVFSRISVSIVAKKDWLMLPVVFLGVNVGVRVDGHFVPDILGPTWTAIIVGAGLMFLKSALARKNRA